MTLNNSNYAQLALARLLPEEQDLLDKLPKRQGKALLARLHEHWQSLFDDLFILYGDQHDFYYHLQKILRSMITTWQSFDASTRRRLLAQRPDWHLTESLIGASGYVDRFAGDFNGLSERVDYLKSYGINFLHLLPFFDVAEGDHDGGYAVRDYRKIRQGLGDKDSALTALQKLRDNGIHIELDFVFNHTSNQHAWAQAALAGNETYRDFYFFFNDQEKSEYQGSLRDIFPDKRQGCFTWNEQLARWVWTTFNSYQWDLNYRNPAVFYSMAEEMMALVELGADVIRLDALAFTWKEKGTRCESLPKVHHLIRCFNAYARIVAPGVLLQSEAIVHPDEVIEYIHPDECPLSYNPMMMALSWEALATGKTGLITSAAQKRQHIPAGTLWVNYLRCHDDIGWAFDDGDAAQLGVNAYDHRQFLTDYFLGRFAGSSARGLPFGENLQNGDCRVTGTLASLCGLETALIKKDSDAIAQSVSRIKLLNSVMLFLPGVPLLYLGDEQLMLNDYSFQRHPEHSNDSRWTHRPDQLSMKPHSPEHESAIDSVSQHWARMIELRLDVPSLQGETRYLNRPNLHALAVSRGQGTQQILLLANFSGWRIDIDYAFLQQQAFDGHIQDIITGEAKNAQALSLAPWQTLWLMGVEHD